MLKKHALTTSCVGVMVSVLVLASSVPLVAAGSGYHMRAGAWGSYSESDKKGTNYDFYSFNPYWGIFLIDPGKGYNLALEFAVEGFYDRHFSDFSGKYQIGVRPVLRVHYGYHEFFSPFLEVSTAGVLYTNLDVPETGSDLNFSSHIGGGFNFRLDDRWVIGTAYRLRHISNAGLSERNSGLNHHQFLLGVSYDY